MKMKIYHPECLVTGITIQAMKASLQTEQRDAGPLTGLPLPRHWNAIKDKRQISIKRYTSLLPQSSTGHRHHSHRTFPEACPRLGGLLRCDPNAVSGFAPVTKATVQRTWTWAETQQKHWQGRKRELRKGFYHPRGRDGGLEPRYPGVENNILGKECRLRPLPSNFFSAFPLPCAET